MLRNKLNPDGTLCRRKTRLVAQGFSQVPGIDFLSTFAPVARLDSLRVLCAIAAKLNLRLYQCDVVTAFLHGDLDTVLYMKPPKMLDEILESIVTSESNHTIADKSRAMLNDLRKSDHTVCRLNKALYGLRQAGKQWHEKIDAVLKGLGLKPSNSDPYLYTDSHDRLTFVLLYVDDIIFASNNAKRVEIIKKRLAENFNLKDLGLADYCLGIEIDQGDKSISLSQSGYIKELLARFKMTDCKHVSTPLVVGTKLEPCLNHVADAYPYRELIGALMYLSVGTRPDITHAVSSLSQFNTCYGKAHWEAGKRILRYLKGTSNMKLIYSSVKDTLIGFADADWGSDVTDRRSYSGYAFCLSGGAISWCSRKQRTVALSSTEAEYMSLTDAAKEAIFLSNLMQELGFANLAKTTIYNDNQSAGKLATNPVFYARSKHIDIKMHFIRDTLKDEKFELRYLLTR